MRAASTRVRPTRRSLWLALAGALIAVFALAAPAGAAPSRWNVVYYYDGAGNHVGTKYVNCSYPFIETYGTVTTISQIISSGPC
jgi:hypothetical protein